MSAFYVPALPGRIFFSFLSFFAFSALLSAFSIEPYFYPVFYPLHIFIKNNFTKPPLWVKIILLKFIITVSAIRNAAFFTFG